MAIQNKFLVLRESYIPSIHLTRSLLDCDNDIEFFVMLRYTQFVLFGLLQALFPFQIFLSTLWLMAVSTDV